MNSSDIADMVASWDWRLATKPSLISMLVYIDAVNFHIMDNHAIKKLAPMLLLE